MVKMKVLAKMLVTKTPAKESVSFLGFGQSSSCWQRRTVSSGNGVVESVSELERGVSEMCKC